MGFKVMPASGLNQDDTIVSDATSYVSVEEFILHWLDRGKDYSDTEAELIQAALVKATDYIDFRFGAVFVGLRLNAGQSLRWPRKGARGADGTLYEGIPVPLKRACYEYAARALVAELAPDPTVAGNIRSVSESVGPISTSTVYMAGTDTFKAYPSADAQLKELCTQLGGVYR